MKKYTKIATAFVAASALVVVSSTLASAGERKFKGGNWVEIKGKTSSEAEGEIENGKDNGRMSILSMFSKPKPQEHDSDAEGKAKLEKFTLKGDARGQFKAWYKASAETWEKTRDGKKRGSMSRDYNGEQSASNSYGGNDGHSGHSGGRGGGSSKGTSASASGGVQASGCSGAAC